MTKRAQLQLLLHGTVVLLIGLLCGVPYSLAITQAWGVEPIRAWRFSHLGLALTGIWLIAVAGVSHLLRLSTPAAAVLVWSFVASGYGFTAALIVGPVFGVRGLEPTGPISNWVAFGGNLVGAGGSLIGLGVMLFGIGASLRATPDS
jgi:hypothetical protein